MKLQQPKPETISDLDIRNKYIDGSRGCYTQHYVAAVDGNEVGFLSLDLGPLEEPLVIYKIFVPRQLRKNGLGTQLLNAAEQLARDLGYEWALVIPKSMDEAFSQGDLELWYRKNGYEQWEEHGFGGIRKRLWTANPIMSEDWPPG